MSQKRKRPKRHFEVRGPDPDRPKAATKEESEIYHVLQYLNNELQKSQQVIHVVKKEHCQLRDGFIFLISKISELQPDIEKDLAGYYATNHNLSGHIELNHYNIDREGRKTA
jgi:hypothetical protein